MTSAENITQYAKCWRTDESEKWFVNTKYCKSYLITYGSTEGVYSGEYISYSSMKHMAQLKRKGVFKNMQISVLV